LAMHSTVRIRRSFGVAADMLQCYEVDLAYDKARVIDALHFIRTEIDPTLGYTYSCDGRRRCGTCGVMINGKPGLACFTKLSLETTIEPLRGFPIIQDLITDRSRYSAKLLEVEPFIEPTSYEAHEESSSSYDRESHLLSDCIECLCCQAACPVVNEEPWKLFGGPVIFVQLGKYAFDPRDSRDSAGLAFAQGIYNCDKCYACEKSCPVNIQIVHSIEKLQQSGRKSEDRKVKSLIEMIEGSI